ncbi:hypothetical protein CXF58_00740 (plasmid) [Psychrobacter sp. Sarcosine-02u-2]|uniref:hypothetical protein n=1 Tax=Psychrobacter sp. Sarcosine-02u-2 TaxID=2058324 RepID=UPI000C7E5588|nr:hypothetical protein [Psychrobacter sp. Sarcosine-02u-2]PKG93488.1 hypothetical protein CXF58_00740 [Psychrobacter sp. Sarcosine-02u-2]
MNIESKVRCEHNAQNWHYRNELGEIVSNRAILTGQIDLETNEISLSDHLEIATYSTKDKISEFAIQNIREIMSEDLEKQLRD